MKKPLSRKSCDRGVLDRHLSMWQHLFLIEKIKCKMRAKTFPTKNFILILRPATPD